MGGGWAGLTGEVRGGLTEKVTFEQRHARVERLSRVDKWGENVAGRKQQRTRERNFLLCPGNMRRPV